MTTTAARITAAESGGEWARPRGAICSAAGVGRDRILVLRWTGGEETALELSEDQAAFGSIKQLSHSCDALGDIVFVVMCKTQAQEVAEPAVAGKNGPGLKPCLKFPCTVA